MKRFPSVKKNTDFQRAYRRGRSAATGELVMYVTENGLAYNRLGVSCSKKIGNSVVRHTLTRKMREIFRLHDAGLKSGLDIILVVRRKAGSAAYQEIEASYLNLCGRHHILKAETERDQASAEELK